MTGVINTGSIAKLLWPGLNAVWGKEYAEHPQEWRDLVDSETSDKMYEQDVLMPGFGLAPIKTEGASISYDSTSQGYTTQYTHIAYGLGFVVTREAIDDNQYERKALGSTADLAFSFRQTKENVVANVYNRAFNSSYVGGDGKELIATDHPIQAGTFSNELATPADLSEASLEDLAVQIMNAVNDRGMKISIMPRALIVPPALVFEATRILKSQLQNDTANNAVNAIRSMGLFPEGVKVNHYLTDTDAYFIRTNAKNGLKLFQRTSPEFTQDNDFDTSNLKYKGYERYSTGWTDPRGLFGSSGA
jgi:hypothetical protein